MILLVDVFCLLYNFAFMASFVILTDKCTNFSPNIIYNMTKRLQRIERNELSRYRL